MEAITNMLQVNFYSTAVNLLVIIAGFKSIITLLEYAGSKSGIELKWMRKKREDHELLINTAKGLRELEEQRKVDVAQSIKHDEAIRNDLAELRAMFIDREIDEMRWSIINFSSELSSGKKFNRESFDHILKIHQKYDRIIEANELKNGLVTESMKYIGEMYRENLKNGLIK